MGPSALQLQRGSHDRLRGDTIQDTTAAWRAVGAPGRAAVVGAALACLAVTAWWASETSRVLGTGASLLVLVAAALVDGVEHRLPNRLVAAALVPTVAALAVGWSADVGRSTLVGAALVGVPLLLTHLVSPAGMGFGDVKAAAVLGAAIGLVDAQLAGFALVLGLATGAAWGVTRRARSVPLGPSLVAGALVALAVGRLSGVTAR